MLNKPVLVCNAKKIFNFFEGPQWNGNKATQLFHVIPAIGPRVYI